MENKTYKKLLSDVRRNNDTIDILIRSGIISIENILNDLKELGNAEEIYYFARNIYFFAKLAPNAQIEKLAEEIIECKNPRYMYHFIIDIPNAPIEKLVDAIIESKNVEYIYELAKNIPNAPIEKLADAIIESKNVEYIYELARNIPNAPIEKLADAIIESKNVKYIYYFAKDIPNASIEKLAYAIIESKNVNYIYYFAKDVPNAPIEKLEDAIIESKNPEYMFYLARDIPNTPVEKLADAIIESKDTMYIYCLAKDVPNAPIEKLADAIIESKDTMYIYYLAKDVPNAPIEKLADAIIESKNPEYIYKFACYVKNLSSDIKIKLANAEIENNCNSYIYIYDFIRDVNIPLNTMLKLSNALIELDNSYISKLLELKGDLATKLSIKIILSKNVDNINILFSYMETNGIKMSTILNSLENYACIDESIIELLLDEVIKEINNNPIDFVSYKKYLEYLGKINIESDKKITLIYLIHNKMYLDLLSKIDKSDNELNPKAYILFEMEFDINKLIEYIDCEINQGYQRTMKQNIQQ